VVNIDYVSEEGLIVAVDFDGTIVESDYPNIGKPIPYAIESLKRMKEAGIRIVIWTCRHDLKPVRSWLNKYGVNIDAINTNDALTEEEWSKFEHNESTKKTADIYIDDRSFINPVYLLGWQVISRRLIELYNIREGGND